MRANSVFERNPCLMALSVVPRIMVLKASLSAKNDDKYDGGGGGGDNKCIYTYRVE